MIGLKIAQCKVSPSTLTTFLKFALCGIYSHYMNGEPGDHTVVGSPAGVTIPSSTAGVKPETGKRHETVRCHVNRMAAWSALDHQPIGSAKRLRKARFFSNARRIRACFSREMG